MDEARQVITFGAATARPALRRKAAATRPLGTHPQLRRLWWALSRLRSGQPLKATDLAREFEVDVRTAYRDIDFLHDEWRIPLEFDRAKGTYLLTEPLAELPAITISEGEVVALYFAERVLAQYRGTRPAPHRVKRATVTTESYEIPKTFDFRRYMADAQPLRPPPGPLDPRAPLAPLGPHPETPRRRPHPPPPHRRDQRDPPLGAAVRARDRGAGAEVAEEGGGG